MTAKIKHPIRTAYAQFLPIINHLDKMQDYLAEADGRGVFGDQFAHRVHGKLAEIRRSLMDLEEMTNPFLEQQ